MPRNHNETTRFGADPILDQELATKAYVDNSGGGGGAFWLGSGSTSNPASTSTVFYSWIFTSTIASNEAFRVCQAPSDVTMSRLKVDVNANTRTGIQTMTNRVANADGNITLDIPASTTGDFSDDVNTDAVSEGDDLTLAIISAAGSGNTQIRAFIIRCEE